MYKNSRLAEMSALVQVWANINSHNQNQEGVVKLLEKIQPVFRLLKPDFMEVVSCGAELSDFFLKKEEMPLSKFI